MSTLGLARRAKTTSVDAFERMCAASEIGLLFIFILAMAWIVPTLAGPLRFFSSAALLTWVFGLMIMSHLAYGETLDDLGFGKKHLRQAFSEILLPVGIIALVLIGIGITLGTIHLRRK